MPSRDFQQINVLIPGYSIEDIPTDLNEKSAASLLNAFATAWHPSLLIRSSCIPDFKQAESTELPTGQHIVFVPECSDEWLGHDWQERLADTLSVVISDCSDRSEYLNAISAAFDDSADGSHLDEGLVKDFLALGTAYLQVTLLSRRMHHYVDADQLLLENEAMAAADAAINGDIETARDHLRRCFECLHECREQFYPVDSYFVDICLPSDQTTSAELSKLLSADLPLSLVCHGDELQRLADTDRQFANQLAESVKSGRLSLLTGHQQELRLSLGSLSTLYSDLAACEATSNRIATDAERHWCRRRFGMSSNLPTVLSHFEFSSALHVVLDDGLYPDREYGQFNWQGADGTQIPATSRIPLAIDGSSSFLRFADRFTESMQEDTNAVLLLARLPSLHTPWLEDLQRAAAYAPVLAKFVTMTDFVDHTSGSASGVKFDEGEYLSPYLIQSSVLKTESPISSPAQLYLTRQRLESLAFLNSVAAILKPKSEVPQPEVDLELQLNSEESQRIQLTSVPTSAIEQKTRLDEIAQSLETKISDAGQHVATCLPGTDAAARGRLLLNPLPWKRVCAIDWPSDLAMPVPDDSIGGVYQQGDRRIINCEVPAGGFVWLTEAQGKTGLSVEKIKGKPLAESLLLRNRFFEVDISDVTGGVSCVRFHDRRANRVSQQVAFRYEQSRTVKLEDEEFVTPYAATRAISSQVVSTGPHEGCIETTCEIVDVTDESVMCRFRQLTIVERNSPRLRIVIEFDEVTSAPQGNPWMTYIAARFAWDNESASITRSILGQARGFRVERFEAPDFIEVADSSQRLLIVPHGRPYHRRTGPRMLDSLLMVEGEIERRFEFTLDFDQPLPLRTAMEVNQPVFEIATENRVPSGGVSAWILGLSAKNIVAARSRTHIDEADHGGARIRVLLEETEGRRATCRIVTVRPIRKAKQILASGKSVADLEVVDGGVSVEFGRFQIKELELTF